ncbi:hypothetical protein BU14_2224s0001, partial [Porphyra umbilicalis]
ERLAQSDAEEAAHWRRRRYRRRRSATSAAASASSRRRAAAAALLAVAPAPPPTVAPPPPPPPPPPSPPQPSAPGGAGDGGGVDRTTAAAASVPQLKVDDRAVDAASVVEKVKQLRVPPHVRLKEHPPSGGGAAGRLVVGSSDGGSGGGGGGDAAAAANGRAGRGRVVAHRITQLVLHPPHAVRLAGNGHGRPLNALNVPPGRHVRGRHVRVGGPGEAAAGVSRQRAAPVGIVGHLPGFQRFRGSVSPLVIRRVTRVVIARLGVGGDNVDGVARAPAVGGVRVTAAAVARVATTAVSAARARTFLPLPLLVLLVAIPLFEKPPAAAGRQRRRYRRRLLRHPRILDPHVGVEAAEEGARSRVARRQQPAVLGAPAAEAAAPVAATPRRVAARRPAVASAIVVALLHNLLPDGGAEELRSANDHRRRRLVGEVNGAACGAAAGGVPTAVSPVPLVVVIGGGSDCRRVPAPVAGRCGRRRGGTGAGRDGSGATDTAPAVPRRHHADGVGHCAAVVAATEVPPRCDATVAVIRLALVRHDPVLLPTDHTRSRARRRRRTPVRGWRASTAARVGSALPRWLSVGPPRPPPFRVGVAPRQPPRRGRTRVRRLPPGTAPILGTATARRRRRRRSRRDGLGNRAALPGTRRQQAEALHGHPPARRRRRRRADGRFAANKGPGGGGALGRRRVREGGEAGGDGRPATAAAG